MPDMKYEDEDFGRISVGLRDKLGITQRDLAQLLDVHHMTISKLERGDYTPTSLQQEIIWNLFQTSQLNDEQWLTAANRILPEGITGTLFSMLLKQSHGRLVMTLASFGLSFALQYIFYLSTSNMSQKKLEEQILSSQTQ